jgi:protoporphyrinogen oxidase
VSGLACALELARRGLPFLAFEKEDRSGGLLRTDEVDGFRFDHGPHILFEAPDVPVDLNAAQGLSGVVLGSRTVPSPFQRHLNHLPAALRARLLFAMLRRRGRSVPRNYAEFAAAQCTRAVFDLFIRPYDTKRLRIELDELPADWTGRVEAASLWSLVAPRWLTRWSARREAHFLYPQSGGIEALPRAMESQLPPGSVRYGEELREIHPASRRAVFSRSTVNYDRLVSTLPLPETIARIPDAPADIRRAASNLLYTSVRVISAGVEGGSPPWTFLRLAGPETNVYRLSFPSRYAAGCTPEGYSTVVGEMAYHPVRAPLDLAEARADFQRMVRRFGRPVVEHVREIRYGHVLYNRDTRASVRHILEYLGRHGIQPCGKYGLWRDLLIQDAIRSGIEASR